MKRIWIVVYDHRYGLDSWPIIADADSPPSIKEITAELSNWEGDTRDDEFIHLTGPFDIDTGERVR